MSAATIAGPEDPICCVSPHPLTLTLFLSYLPQCSLPLERGDIDTSFRATHATIIYSWHLTGWL